MSEIKMSDLMWIMAEAVIALGEKTGQKVHMVDAYQKSSTEMAWAGKCVMEAVEKVTGNKITVIKD